MAGSPRLRIVDMVDEATWEALQARPRFLQPVELSTSPCAHCPGHCCHSEIRLGVVEAFRISLTLETPVLDVVHVDVVRERSEVDHRLTIPTADLGPVRLRLKTREGGGCMFLFQVGPRGRCGIHALRPGPCRLYPFHVEVGERRVSVGGQVQCPVGWVQTETTRARVEKDLAGWDADLAREGEVLDLWKARPEGVGTLEEFLWFALSQLAAELGFPAQAQPPKTRRRLGSKLW